MAKTAFTLRIKSPKQRIPTAKGTRIHQEHKGKARVKYRPALEESLEDAPSTPQEEDKPGFKNT